MATALNWYRNLGRTSFYRPRRTWLCGLVALCAAHVSADAPVISVSHRFLSWTESPDGQIGGAEYAFTLTNEGVADLYDVRLVLGIGAPESPGPDGDPSLRLAELLAGATATVVYTVTARPWDEHLAMRVDLVGWVEAIEGHGGPIERVGIVGRVENER
jgi:hypothetical protein